MAFYQCRNVAVLSADQQITFPMTGDRAIFRFRGSFADGDSVDDLTARLSTGAGMARAAHAPFRPQVVHQLFFQYSPRLNEQAAVYRLVGHAHALVIGILGLQPSGNLFGRPVQEQFTRNDVAQLAVRGKKTSFRSQPRVPSLLIRIMSATGRTATVVGDFPAHRRGCSIQSSSNFTKRGATSHPSRDVFSLSQGEC